MMLKQILVKIMSLRSFLLLLWFSSSQILAYEAISKDVREQIEPYLMPDNHPAKKRLDHIFKKTRAIADEKSLKKAGFTIKKRKNNLHIYVAEHPKLNSYLLKFMLDSQIGTSDSHLCLSRIRGSNLIDKNIKKHKLTHLLKVPKKWIYLLPENPPTPKGYDRKHMILVVEKLNILSAGENTARWKSSNFTTKEKLNALYIILSTCGLIDSVYIDNIPYSADGRIAFVDTEHSGKWPVPYHKLSRYLSSKRKSYWEELTK